MVKNIKREYLTPHFSAAYSGLSTFLKNKKKYMDKKEVERELNMLESYSLSKPARKKFKTRRVVVNWPGFQFGVDLINLQTYASENNGYSYIFVMVCAFSKFLFTKAIKQKTGETLLRTFREFFRDKRLKNVKFIHMDRGSEFVNKKVQDFLKSKGVKSFSTYSPSKVSYCERVIRTLMGRLGRVWIQRKNHQYLKVLKQITQSYNATIHSSIGIAPRDVTNENSDIIWRRLYGKYMNEKPGKPKFSISDIVRISRVKDTFEKGYSANFTRELFRIKKINMTVPITYSIQDMKGEDILGSFYTEELSLVPTAEERVSDSSVTSETAVEQNKDGK